MLLPDLQARLAALFRVGTIAELLENTTRLLLIAIGVTR
jgi:hypothetical protein